ncbi:MAG: adenylosuccinate lyase [Bacteroidia bacterium]|nr:adenylosuccinate lyase [Bacteroidia bacterium]MDW8334321.1 adenylosuccinate lyase [Bacteroidia bacterium]
MNPLTAVSPVDGRYREWCAPLTDYFSEWAYFRYRLKVEIEYLLALEAATASPVEEGFAHYLRSLHERFTPSECEKIKRIEQTTRHDVKALEYYLREAIAAFPDLNEDEKRRRSARVHFGLTSQDVNSTALSLMLRDGLEKAWRPALTEVQSMIEEMSRRWVKRPMMARTHGQPASPVTVGKEFKVFFDRLERQAAVLDALPHCAKFGGATGNFNAHCVAFPHIRWDKFADDFLMNVFGLHRLKTTTQIDPYDGFAEKFDAVKRINVVLIDLCRDLWQYISMDYFKLKIESHEVGSSTMPHKVNPIDFETAEGNLGLSNAILTHLSEKLPVSRLQRDLTDSTVVRNVGVPLAHALVALRYIASGLRKLELDDRVVEADLSAHAELLTEAVQTLMRAFGDDRAYEKLKNLSRGEKRMSLDDLRRFVETLPLPDEARSRLLALEPRDYVGLAPYVWDE